MRTPQPMGSDSGDRPDGLDRRDMDGGTLTLIEFIDNFSLARDMAASGPAASMGCNRAMGDDGCPLFITAWAFAPHASILHKVMCILGDVGPLEFIERMSKAFPD